MSRVTLILNAAFGLLAVTLLILGGVLLLHAQTVMLVVLVTQSMGRFAFGLGASAVFLALYIVSVWLCGRARKARQVSLATVVWALMPAAPAALLTVGLIRYGMVLFGSAE